jgi:hypothetical protein
LDQVKVGFRKLGRDFGVFAKKSEREIVKASKAGKIQLDVLNMNLQKEKIYYEIGKKLTALNAKKKLNIPEIEPYWNRIRKLENGVRRKKRDFSIVRRQSGSEE